MENEKEYYKGEIIEMVQKINDKEILNYIFIIIRDIIEEESEVS